MMVTLQLGFEHRVDVEFVVRLCATSDARPKNLL